MYKHPSYIIDGQSSMALSQMTHKQACLHHFISPRGILYMVWRREWETLGWTAQHKEYWWVQVILSFIHHFNNCRMAQHTDSKQCQSLQTKFYKLYRYIYNKLNCSVESFWINLDSTAKPKIHIHIEEKLQKPCIDTFCQNF